MFDLLIETKSSSRRTPGGIAASLVMHVAAIGAAVVATTNVGIADAPQDARDEIVFVRPEPPRPVQPPPLAVITAPPVKGFQILVAPVTIPDALPAIDLSQPVTDAANFTGVGIPGGIADGGRDGSPALVNVAPTYLVTQVEKPAMQVRGAGVPAYPELLRTAGVEGEVVASFVVDTTGRAVVGSFRVIASAHALFTESIRAELSRMRFLPAEVGGRKVRQLVQLPFQFTFKH